ncbi:hypothetical protein PoB_007349900 [Plakobranchus ocellatus]|uniref:Uncharacterized protein n=1 Tax=Plakobranchus ocellatus TaxID=259542 RepID=A0AAV4DSN0_9GAST|nr:hypothetical protein PoB_007349900 [Plakobranchus ocellatus]
MTDMAGNLYQRKLDAYGQWNFQAVSNLIQNTSYSRSCDQIHVQTHEMAQLPLVMESETLVVRCRPFVHQPYRLAVPHWFLQSCNVKIFFILCTSTPHS